MKPVTDEFQSRQTLSNQDFEIFHYKDLYLKPLDFHSHDFYELYFFIDGNVTYYIEENIYPLSYGSLLIIPPGELHRPSIDPSISYERVVLWISKNFLKDCFNDNPAFYEKLIEVLHRKNHYEHFDAEEYTDILSIIKNISIYRSSKDIIDSVLINPYLNILFYKLLKKCTSAKREKNDRINEDNVIPNVIAYINNNLFTPLNLDKICEKFFLSKFHLLRKFKEYTNCTISQYIRIKRINQAKIFLEQGLPAEKASRLCGFSNYSNFYKSFVKETSLSPAQYVSAEKQKLHQ